MPALEPLVGRRVIGDPDALDAAIWSGRDVVVLRLAPDEAFGIGATAVELDDEHAIDESEAGFVGAVLSTADLADVIARVDWSLPSDPSALAQGKVAGVPAKLLIGDPSLLVTHAAYAGELADRLGWSS
ncbi:MAG: hypothetical protein H0U52_07455 [Chloroflexi bacterium]|nr:hypothetical protein [Chloroflexota bacterium]